MSATIGDPGLDLLADLDGHVCLVVDDDLAYADLAASFLSGAEARGEKTVAFGPEGCPVREQLRPHASVVADPYVDVLKRGHLDPEGLFATLSQETAKARDEGYSGLRVAADMNWLLPAARSDDDTLRFEVLLDRVVSEAGATVLCAYRRTSFSPETILGMLCSHPVTAGHAASAPFKLVADAEGGWVLSGEIDLAVASVLVPMLAATAGEPWVVDISGLTFSDVAGLRAFATAAVDAGRALELRGASEKFQRYWRLGGFDDVAQDVTFSELAGGPRQAGLPKNRPTRERGR